MIDENKIKQQNECKTYFKCFKYLSNIKSCQNIGMRLITADALLLVEICQLPLGDQYWSDEQNASSLLVAAAAGCCWHASFVSTVGICWTTAGPLMACLWGLEL